MAYIILVIKHRRRKLYDALKRARLLDWAIYLNLRDIMFVIAEKKPSLPGMGPGTSKEEI